MAKAQSSMVINCDCQGISVVKRVDTSQLSKSEMFLGTWPCYRLLTWGVDCGVMIVKPKYVVYKDPVCKMKLFDTSRHDRSSFSLHNRPANCSWPQKTGEESDPQKHTRPKCLTAETLVLYQLLWKAKDQLRKRCICTISPFRLKIFNWLAIWNIIIWLLMATKEASARFVMSKSSHNHQPDTEPHSC